MKISKRILLIISYQCLIANVHPQDFPQLRFQRLTENNGLSSNKVFCIRQDKNGLMWFGTDNGLNRYDGYRFKHFFSYSTDSTSLTSNFIRQIEVDDKNNLWLSTHSGISYFNTNSQKAFKYQHDPGNPASFVNDVTPAIFIDKSGDLPYIFSEYLYKFNSPTTYQKLDTRLPAYQFQGNEIKSYTCFYRDKKNRLWAKSASKVYLLDEKKLEPAKTLDLSDKGIVQSIFFDDDNRCWIPCWSGGCYIYDEENNKWSLVKNTKTGIGVYHIAAGWTINDRKFIVIGYDDGILLVDTKTGDSKFYNHEAFGKGIQFKLDVSDVYIDRQNILWLATNQGVFHVSPGNSLFDIVPVEMPGKNDSTLATYVYNIKEEPSGFWISKRYFGGVYWFDKNWKLIKYWKELKPGNKNKNMNDGDLLTEAYDFVQKGNSMFMSTNAGIVEMNLKSLSSVLYYPAELKQPPSLRNIVPVSDSLWWVRSFDQGVFLFDPVTKKFTARYPGSDLCKDCQPAVLNYLLRTAKDQVFITSFTGLFQYDKTENIFKPVKPANGSAFISPLQKGMTEDKNGVLWVATDIGPYAYDPATNKIVKTFSEKENINEVLRITTDNYDNVWFCSSTGYWCWIRRQDKLLHFSFSMGLPEIDDGTFYTTGDGTVYGGGKDAVIKFHADQLMNYNINTSCKIVEANVNSRYKPFQVSADGNKYLRLNPYEKNITVDFAIINYDIAGNSQFFYKLSPGEDDWKQNEDGHLSFNNLPPGKYTLQVKGSNKITGKFTDTDTLVFSIQPRLYQTAWFRILLASVLLMVAFLFYKWRIASVKKQARLKQKISETEMMALRAQMNPHFIFNCLNSIDNLIQNNEKEKATTYLAKFAKLIRAILENSKSNTIPCWKDIETLRLYLELEEFRWDKKFSYHLNIDPEILQGDYKVPPLVIQPYVENAIHHGLLNKEGKGKLLSIDVKAKNNHIYYTIEDNGIGRKKAMEYKTLNKPSHQSMGLDITLERINLFNQDNNGSVLFTDLYDEKNQPAGTRVQVTLNNQS